MKLKNSTIGIWGLGRVGNAAASFFHKQGLSVIVYDDNSALLERSSYIIAPSRETFLQSADYIVASPGIDTRPYRLQYPQKWLNEVDIFYTYFKKPIIAITGSVGKTTITQILVQILLKQGIRTLAAGNVGLPMLDIIEQQDSLDMVVLEVSSFQLEFAQLFAPHLAIWTNFYPNHLDRHDSMDAYFDAKCSLLKNQHTNHRALVPDRVGEQLASHYAIKSSLSFFSQTCGNTSPTTSLFCIDQSHKEIHHHGTNKTIAFDAFGSSTFLENWLIIWATLHLLNILFVPIDEIVLEHRLEKVAVINGTVFYNDSKSTIPHSTLCALEQFSNKRILLFLGGYAKGIDRRPLIKALQQYHIHVICFGKEADEIKALCDAFSVSADAYSNLDKAFDAIFSGAKPYECVLFSPAGSSYDLFQNYQERGSAFKRLVHRYKKMSS